VGVTNTAGLLYSTVTQVDSAADGSETTLVTFTVPADSFDPVKVCLFKLRAVFDFAHNTHTKTITIYVGSNSGVPLLVTTSDGQAVTNFEFWVKGTGIAEVLEINSIKNDGTIDQIISTGAIDTAPAITSSFTIRLTGASDHASSDISMKVAYAEWVGST
jgi:hypothetical protein